MVSAGDDMSNEAATGEDSSKGGEQEVIRSSNNRCFSLTTCAQINVCIKELCPNKTDFDGEYGYYQNS
jgi:hypothetical protein